MAFNTSNYIVGLAHLEVVMSQRYLYAIITPICIITGKKMQAEAGERRVFMIKVASENCCAGFV